MPYRRELRNRLESRIVGANQIATGRIRSARYHGIRLIARLTTCIFCLAFVGGCNHTEYKSDGIRTAVRNDVTVGHPNAGTPVPARSLLVPQPAPNCEFASTDVNADDRQKLDYERQCYRHAEIIARTRLQQLQASVDRTIRAVRQQEQRVGTWSRSHRHRQGIFWSCDSNRRA